MDFYFLGNELEENCYLFVFKNSIYHIKNESIYYNDIQTRETCTKSLLIGYCDIKYYKNNYINLVEYLFHSVYDTKSLAQASNDYFSPFDYLNNFPETPPDPIEQSPFRKLYHEFYIQKQTSLADCRVLDEHLAIAFHFVDRPNDWNLLGQHFFHNKGM